MKHTIQLLICVVALLSCNQQQTKSATTTTTTTNITAVSAPIDTSSLTITEPCAVMYQPGNAKLKKWESSEGEEAINTILDDNSFYLSQSELYLDSLKIKVVNTEAGHIYFVKKDGSKKMMDISDTTHFMGIILFNGKDDPMDADITDIPPDVQKYWK